MVVMKNFMKPMKSLSFFRGSPLSLPYFNGHTILSKKVPTEYDVVMSREDGEGQWVLNDDRGRNFHGPTLRTAWMIAEFFQDKRDPIHTHCADPAESDAPLTIREMFRQRLMSAHTK